MIAHLEGVLREKTPARIVVMTGGVGYEAWIPLSTFMELPDEGKTVSLHVHTHVREEAFQLYAFTTGFERALFELLLRATGVGPRLALAILSGLEATRLLDAIRHGAVATLRAIPGVGPKLAERIVVELRERAADLAVANAASTGPQGVAEQRLADGPPASDEAVSALVNLGYPRAQAQRLVDEAVAEIGAGASLEICLKAALRRSAR
ncbi:MAG: Holliday junction branch migration protein RuvA [Deltaproteobacteria bacterium]|nr:Holliday junction branch migration protein RuvA [Deltaproteobacteria bacterium]